jgi:SAM-dependent methyltransferase
MQGRERLRLLNRVLRPATLAYFERAGIAPGNVCLDAGCGGGDVTLDLARLVGPAGRVVGIDIDDTKLDIARSEAAEAGVSNVEFRHVLIGSGELPQAAFDVIYCRFVLTHLPDPEGALRELMNALRPNGKLLTADIDFTGYVCYPPSEAHERFLDLYKRTVLRRGGDPAIGLRLPDLLRGAGFEEIELHAIQPLAVTGEAKLLPPTTMENIAEAVIAEGLSTAQERQRIVAELYDFASASHTIAGTPRVMEVWGRKPAT